MIISLTRGGDTHQRGSKMRIPSHLLHLSSHSFYTEMVGACGITPTRKMEYPGYLLHQNDARDTSTPKMVHGTYSISPIHKMESQRFPYTKSVYTAYLLHKKTVPSKSFTQINIISAKTFNIMDSIYFIQKA